MKRGIILTRKHGAQEINALGSVLPYHEQVARFKKEFQADSGGVHKDYEEVFLVPVEAAASKRVRFTTAKQAAEQAAFQANAIASARNAVALSDETKSAMANVADAKNQIGHFERALEIAGRNQDQETKIKSVQIISDRLKAAKADLERAEDVLKKIQAKPAKNKKADAEVKAEAEAKTPNESK